MGNRDFYNALINAIERTKANEIYDKVIKQFFDVFEIFGLKDLEEYREDIDYKKVFLRIYYDYIHETSFNHDYEGRSTSSMEEDTTVAIFETVMYRMSGNNNDILKQYKRRDVTDLEYNDLIKIYSPSWHHFLARNGKFLYDVDT